MVTDIALPSNVQQYFGLSNDFRFGLNEFDEQGGIRYFRYNQTMLTINPSLQFSSPLNTLKLRLGAYYQYANLTDNNDRFITDDELSDLEPADFLSNNYVGLTGDWRIRQLDNNSNPSIGVDFRFRTSYNYNLSDSDESFTRIMGDLRLYNLIWLPKPFVLATKVSAGINIGEFDFYQAHFAGFDKGLRAFRQNRFGGKSSLIVSNDSGQKSRSPVRRQRHTSGRCFYD